jgi:hypothetical protein
MSDIRFADVIQRERKRLHRDREEILNQQKELKDKLTKINGELVAIDAYEAAKTGKAAASRGERRDPVIEETSIKPSSAPPLPRARIGNRREALLRVIGETPNGLSRGEIFVHMDLKGDKSAEKSLSNALTALTKSKRVSRRGGKYVIGR